MTRTLAKTRDFLQEAHDRFERCVRAESKQRERWLDDMRFESGEQWPEAIRRLREDPVNPRPCLTINKTQLHVRQIVNDMRQNRPQIKCLPVDSKADIKTAEILSGLIRNIETQSDADIAYDTAAHPQVAAGLGYIRVGTRVVDARLNLQEIQILPVWNALSVYMDPEIEHPAGADARFAFVIEDMADKTFTDRYPKAKAVDFRDKGQGDSSRNWFPSGDSVRVADYYYIVRKEETFIEDQEGNVYSEDGWVKAGSPPPRATRRQFVNCCYYAKITGAEILEEREIPCSYIPVVRVPGAEVVIDGERCVKGIVRDMRDPARVYNYWVTLNTETIALAPKAPILAPMGAIEGHEPTWARANVDNLPYLPYNHMDEQGQPIPMPQRAQPPQQSTAIVQAIAQADQDLMSVAGRYEASIGAQGDEKSGRAIIARQRQGDNATYHFADNLNRALRVVGRILVDMIPRVYDTERMVRVLGEDGSTKFAAIDPSIPAGYQQTQDARGKFREVYNLGVGHYDVTCITGPSFATRRQEAAEMMTELVRADPTLMQKAADIIVKGYDMPMADELAKRVKMFLPPEIAAQEAEDGDENDPQVIAQQAQKAAMQQVMAQVQPIVQELQASLDQAAQAAAEKDAEIQQLRAQIAGREAEAAAKVREAEIRAEADTAKSESEIVRLVLEKALTQPDEPEEPEDEGPDQTEQMVSALAEQVAALREEVHRPRRKQVRINEYDEQGMPVGASVVEVSEE